MKPSNGFCKKHDEIEPENHDLDKDGLWFCPKCTNKINKINNLKLMDFYLEQIKDKTDKILLTPSIK